MVLSIFNQQQQTTTHFIKKTDGYNLNSTYAPTNSYRTVEAGRYDQVRIITTKVFGAIHFCTYKDFKLAAVKDYNK